FIKRDWTTIDIGANIGRYTKHLSKFSKRVIAIEPTPFTFTVLENTIKKLGLANVEAKCCALSDHIGTGTMAGPNIYEAHLEAGNDVPVRTIDSILTGDERVDFIKCDVEGHELQVVRGSLETIKNFHPAWLIEANHDAPIFAFMS